MKILVVGGGGREHALAWKLAQSDRVREVLVAPGNAGTALEPGVRNVDIGAEDIGALIEFARGNGVDLTVVGPEAPLVAGIVDRFQAEGLTCFGPTRQAARLEGSKRFAKEFLRKYNIPTAAYESFTETGPAIEYMRARGAPIVIKADGLAAGKGVVLAATQQEAETAIREMLESGAYGQAGRRVVIEDYLTGEEASFICMVGGGRVLPMASSQDHKARDDGDTGPNTGGMGAYSPAPLVDRAMHEKIMSQVIVPTVHGLSREGIDYQGFLYAGLMIDSDGTPQVLEFNCRFGDPETQPIMMRLESDLVELIEAAISGRVDETPVRWDPRASLGVVMAAGGYPFEYEKGHVVEGLGDDFGDHTHVFHAGTSLRDGRVVTSGGRVLCVTALGNNVLAASERAYKACGKIHWPGAFYRKDIGHRAISRERSTTD
jgi:phosphoribosylamine--glycine ligase